MDNFTTVTSTDSKGNTTQKVVTDHEADLESKIEVLTKERDSHIRSLDRALAQIERMLIDRDALRRELSQVIASYHGEDTVAIAVERGWNCFENCTQVEGEWLVNGGKA